LVSTDHHGVEPALSVEFWGCTFSDNCLQRRKQQQRNIWSKFLRIRESNLLVLVCGHKQLRA
jgi:hypothetical protein